MNDRRESANGNSGPTGVATKPSEKYVIRGGVEGRERLRLLSEVMGPSTGALLSEVGIPPGAKCLDIGCGGGDVTFELARAVGPTGLAVGVDFDETKLEIARREAGQRGLANIVFESRDVTQWKPDQLFDLVYARFLLTHLTDPQSLVSAIRDQTNAGGVAVVEDIDFRGHFSEPECPALQRYVQWYTSSVQRRGADPNIGPRLPALLRKAGFEDVQMRLVHPAALVGGIKLLTCVTLENISDAVLRDGLATAEELRDSINELYAFARDPHTLLGGPRIFQAWGRKAEPAA
jgi:ubiquinone/menaquinone biosynthesis C-methylase UbiE